YSDTATGASYVGCLISPNIVICANHRHPERATLRFVTMRNQLVTRTVKAGLQVGNTDIWVGILDYPLPLAVRPAKLLPADYSKYFSESVEGVAIVYANQFRTLRIAEWSPRKTAAGKGWPFVKPAAANRAAWWGDAADAKTTAVSYDSGSAVLL